MITRIVEIKRAGPFEDWRTRDETPPCRKTTVLYGANGSGKSTLASVLARAGTQSGIADGLTVEIHGGDLVRSAELDAALWRRLRVFNSAFVREHLKFEASSATSLLTLGKEAIDRAAALDVAREAAELAKVEAARAETEAGDLIRERDRALQSCAKRIRDDCQSHVGSVYDSGSFNKRKVFALLAREPQLRDRLSLPAGSDLPTAEFLDNRRDELVASMHAPPAEKIETLGWPLIDWPTEQARFEAILRRQPVSDLIGDLIAQPDAARWVGDGRHLHHDRATCYFCDGELSDARREALGRHFSEELEQLHVDIDRSIGWANDQVERLRLSLQRVKDSAPVLSLFSESEIAVWLEAAGAEIAATLRYAGALCSAMEDKRRATQRVVQITPTPLPSCADAKELQNLVELHNAHAARDMDRKREAAERIEACHALAIRDEIASLDEKIKAAEIAKDSASTASAEAEGERNRLEASEHGDPEPLARELNADIARLFGRNELRFEVVADGYQIQRNGRPAVALSEGERNAIALLYFLAQLRQNAVGFERPAGGWIVVVDDPVSSMDSGALMGVSALLWARLVQNQQVAQVLLLTHSTELLRLWVQALGDKLSVRTPRTPGGAEREPNAVVAELRSSHVDDGNGGLRREPSWMTWPADAAAERLGSEYRYLFWRLATEYRTLLEPGASLAAQLDAFAVVPNLARRLLEGFLSFRAPEEHGNVQRQVEAVFGNNPDFDVRRLTTLLNHHSHHQDVNVMRALEPGEGLATLRDLFEFMARVDAEHVRRMGAAVGVDVLCFRRTADPIDDAGEPASSLNGPVGSAS